MPRRSGRTRLRGSVPYVLSPRQGTLGPLRTEVGVVQSSPRVQPDLNSWRRDKRFDGGSSADLDELASRGDKPTPEPCWQPPARYAGAPGEGFRWDPPVRCGHR